MVTQGHLDIDNEPLKQKCFSLIESKEWSRSPNGVFIDVIDSRNASLNKINSANPHHWDEFTTVVNKIKTLVGDLPITNSWFNITEVGGEMKEHFHPLASKFVFVYYINCDESHPPIEFFIDNEWRSYECVSGDWLLFPKNTLHRVKANNSTPDRISISVNI